MSHTAPPREERPASTRPRGELDWIRFIRDRAGRMDGSGPPNAAVRLGIGDDCAILRPTPGDEILVTTDFTLEGRHFHRDWHPPESVGHRALARGLSDLAAMGARPLAAFLSLALPASTAREARWVERFLDGLLSLAERVGVSLAGGDTSESPSEHVLADIVLLGAAPAGTALRRSGARAGDGLYVTGTLGGAAAELRSLRRGAPGTSVGGRDHPQLYPEPRLGAGAELRTRGWATACMDLSDGLSTDLAHLCEASGVGAEIDFAKLPASPWLEGSTETERTEALLHGGEDYELLFTVAPETPVPNDLGGLPLTRIGTILPWRSPAESIILRRPGLPDEPLRPAGWEHLR